MVETLDGRKNLTYSSYLFSIGYKIRITVLFLEGENLALKCGFPLAGTRRIAPWKIAPSESPDPNPNPTPPPRQFKSSRGSFLKAILWGGFSYHAFGHHHIKNVCVLGERESSSHQNHKRGQIKGRHREGECGRRIARKIRVLARMNFAICVHHQRHLSTRQQKS